MAHILNITQRIKQDPTTFVSLQDFATTDGGSFDPTLILTDKTLTLYCYDADSDQAIFAKTPQGVDLTAAPFFYQAQYEHATQLVALSKGEFIKLGSMAPEPQNPIIMIHSVGRCGSTLLSQVFDALPETISLSEPDIFSNFLLMRGSNGRYDAQLVPLIKAALKIQLKSLPERQEVAHWCIKFRSSAFEIADLISQTSLPSKNIFLYRNLTDQTRSAIRAFGLQTSSNRKMKGALLERWLTLVPMLKKYKWRAKWGQLDRVDLSILAWMSRMDRYLQLHQIDAPIFAVRYEDLIRNPEQIVKHILRQTDYADSLSSQTLHVFQRDSQAGSKLAQDKIGQNKGRELTAKHQQQISKYIKNHPIINAPDYLLPKTVV